MFYINSFTNLQQNIKIGLKQNLYIIHTPDWFEEKTKSEYTMWSISKGNVYINIDNKGYTASAGDIVLFNPGINHTAHTDSGGCEFLFQQFSLEHGNDINILCEINLPGIIKKEYLGSKCLSYCEAMKKVTMSNLSLGVYAIFFTYLVNALELIQDGKHEPFFENISNFQRSNLWRAMSYIGEHFFENLSIKQIAKQAGFSEKYFIQQFRQMLGIPPKQYLIQCRMRYAAHMLIHSDEKIQNIAICTGYPDVYSFSKAFKKYYDESPLNFRKNHISHV